MRAPNDADLSLVTGMQARGPLLPSTSVIRRFLQRESRYVSRSEAEYSHNYQGNEKQS